MGDGRWRMEDGGRRTDVEARDSSHHRITHRWRVRMQIDHAAGDIEQHLLLDSPRHELLRVLQAKNLSAQDK